MGDYLQQANEDRSNKLLKSLFHLDNRKVWIERDGVEVEVNAQDVGVGETVVCNTGELIAVDGIVLSGEALLNKSCINGESVPVPAVEGDTVTSGSVIENGRLRILATKVGSDTNLSQINRFLERTLKNKSQPELRGEKLADRLVPVTLGIGAAAYAKTADLSRTASLLSIDFVCSVKFPAPVSVKSSLYAAGKSGVLLKGGSALDALAQVGRRDLRQNRNPDPAPAPGHGHRTCRGNHAGPTAATGRPARATLRSSPVSGHSGGSPPAKPAPGPRTQSCFLRITRGPGRSGRSAPRVSAITAILRTAWHLSPQTWN